MRIVETERGVSVAEDRDKDGNTIYRILRGEESLVPVASLQEAMRLAKVVRPRKVVCHKCGQADIESFLAEVGIGQLRVTGSGGWVIERLFGGQSDTADLAFCPECVKKEHEECMRWIRTALEPH